MEETFMGQRISVYGNIIQSDSMGNPCMEFWERSSNGTFSQEQWSNSGQTVVEGQGSGDEVSVCLFASHTL